MSGQRPFSPLSLPEGWANVPFDRFDMQQVRPRTIVTGADFRGFSRVEETLCAALKTAARISMLSGGALQNEPVIAGDRVPNYLRPRRGTVVGGVAAISAFDAASAKRYSAHFVEPYLFKGKALGLSVVYCGLLRVGGRDVGDFWREAYYWVRHTPTLRSLDYLSRSISPDPGQAAVEQAARAVSADSAASALRAARYAVSNVYRTSKRTWQSKQ